MYSLSTLKRLNNRPPAQVESHINRESSFSQSKRGLVLHSAEQRGTVFLPNGLEADAFLASWQATDDWRTRNKLVLRFF